MMKNTFILIYKYLLITIKKIIFVSNKLVLHPQLIHYTFWKLNFFFITFEVYLWILNFNELWQMTQISSNNKCTIVRTNKNSRKNRSNTREWKHEIQRYSEQVPRIY